MSFQVPANYVGVSFETNTGISPETTLDGLPLGHFVIYSGKGLNVSRTSTPSSIPVYCRPLTENRTLRVHAAMARMYQCANSSDGRSIELDVGHDLLIWRQNGVTCEVSLHGHSLVNQDLDLEIANGTSMVFPRRSSS